MRKVEAQAILLPVLDHIRTCIVSAWSEWDSIYAKQHSTLDARARASIVYCHIVKHATALLTEMPGVVCKKIRGVFWVFIGDQITLRFKKANANGLTQNVLTAQQRLIERQYPIPEIFPTTYLNAVYQLDRVERSIQSMMITLQQERQIMWRIDLSGEADLIDNTVPMAPAPSSPAPSSPTTGRAKVKREFERKKGVAGS